MYSDKREDKFSIVSKLSKSVNKNKEIKIFNGGENIRDYIHVKDVVKLYNYFMKSKNLKNSVYDIGAGRGIKLIDLVEYIGVKKFKLKKINKKIDEVDVSFATNDHLSNFKFKDLETYFSKSNKTKIKKLKQFKKQNKNILQDIIEDHIIYGTGNAGKQVYRLLWIKIECKLFCDDDKKLTKHF